MLKQKKFRSSSSNTRKKDKTYVVYNGPGNRDIVAAAKGSITHVACKAWRRPGLTCSGQDVQQQEVVVNTGSSKKESVENEESHDILYSK